MTGLSVFTNQFSIAPLPASQPWRCSSRTQPLHRPQTYCLPALKWHPSLCKWSDHPDELHCCTTWHFLHLFLNSIPQSRNPMLCSSLYPGPWWFYVTTWSCCRVHRFVLQLCERKDLQHTTYSFSSVIFPALHCHHASAVLVPAQFHIGVAVQHLQKATGQKAEKRGGQGCHRSEHNKPPVVAEPKRIFLVKAKLQPSLRSKSMSHTWGARGRPRHVNLTVQSIHLVADIGRIEGTSRNSVKN